MDIEYGERSFLETIDINYACKYFKQFILESHPYFTEIHRNVDAYHLLRKLEECFMLFHRDTRFFREGIYEETGIVKKKLKRRIKKQEV